ncbi:ZIP family zinc transporter [Nocardia fluminea]|uniref:ZIP family zinc transporter n=2 Tax=Nocardia fluminea TaxID=134984 RepID=A0A2N3VBX0_9NOCA|nr:ZIP family zinc transporter [Nocardia fluminea]
MADHRHVGEVEIVHEREDRGGPRRRAEVAVGAQFAHVHADHPEVRDHPLGDGGEPVDRSRNAVQEHDRRGGGFTLVHNQHVNHPSRSIAGLGTPPNRLSDMSTALLYGLGTAVPLLLGVAVGLRWTLPKAVLAAMMAFGAGTMIAAISEELFAPAFHRDGALLAGTALFAGAGVYVVANHLIENKLGPAAIGWALLLGTVLDGVPENLALGVSLSGGGGLVLVVAIAAGNVPEAVSGAVLMREQHGFEAGRTFALWAVTAAVLVAVTVLGNAYADSVSPTAISAVQAFAGGATIAVLADSLIPEAYREGGWWVGMATAAGFFVAFAIG